MVSVNMPFAIEICVRESSSWRSQFSIRFPWLAEISRFIEWLSGRRVDFEQKLSMVQCSCGSSVLSNAVLTWECLLVRSLRVTQSGLRGVRESSHTHTDLGSCRTGGSANLTVGASAFGVVAGASEAWNSLCSIALQKGCLRIHLPRHTAVGSARHSLIAILDNATGATGSEAVIPTSVTSGTWPPLTRSAGSPGLQGLLPALGDRWQAAQSRHHAQAPRPARRTVVR